MERSIVGDLINFRGLVYSPMNENGVIFLFGKVIEDLNMYIEEIKPGFPDCIGRRFTGKGWEKVRIEFEYTSKHFEDHKHDPKDCDLIVCWEHNWEDCPLEVIELRDIIKGLPNRPVTRPDQSISEEKYNIEDHYNRGTKKIVTLFNELEEKVKEFDEEIYRKVAKYSLNFYSPERVFAYTHISKQAIRIELFTGGKKISGVKNYEPEDSSKGGAKWGRMYLRKKDDMPKVVEILHESFSLIKQAIKNNEPTGWYAPINEDNEE